MNASDAASSPGSKPSAESLAVLAERLLARLAQEDAARSAVDARATGENLWSLDQAMAHRIAAAHEVRRAIAAGDLGGPA